MAIWRNINTERLYHALSEAPELRQIIGESVVEAEEASDRISVQIGYVSDDLTDVVNLLPRDEWAWTEALSPADYREVTREFFNEMGGW